MTTQYANASYQEVIDLHTESDRVSIVGIHTPCSDTPYHMLKGFWDQFRKFKYNGCSMTLVPAAQLPADPLQVSYDAGEPTIDPRDMLNPIMFHGCHGDDMGAILNGLYSDPVSGSGQMILSQMADSVDHNMAQTTSGGTPVSDVFEALYYRALTDKTWLKAHPQRGFRKSGLHPMVYQVASTVQFAGVSGTTSLNTRGFVHDDDTGQVTSGLHGVFGTGPYDDAVQERSGFGRPTFDMDGNHPNWWNPVSRTMEGFITPRLQRLGWMDTRQVVGLNASDSVHTEGSSSVSMDTALKQMYLQSAQKLKPVLTPKLFMGMLMLPPAYKTEQHFRLVLNHSFSFAKFRGASMQYDNLGMVGNAYSYFDFSGQDDSKHIDPPEPDPKGDEKNEF